MSSFVWMKVLESAPERYDRGIRMLSSGRIDAVYERIAALAAEPGWRVLDIGCGTGAVSLACAARGAEVTGIDINAEMLETARDKPVPDGGTVAFVQMAAAEVEDHFAKASFDAVVSCLAFSEMSQDEQDYALGTALNQLVPGGVVVVADEAEPATPLRRLAHRVKRLPVVAATYLVTQTSTRPVAGIGQRMRAAGFVDVTEEGMLSGAFLLAHGRRP
jgi:demethylmenaquinone methyltransferase/2-methoxy-6-polyprenyl-1,4-benzoquinol methylase